MHDMEDSELQKMLASCLIEMTQRGYYILKGALNLVPDRDIEELAISIGTYINHDREN